MMTDFGWLYTHQIEWDWLDDDGDDDNEYEDVDAGTSNVTKW